MQRILYISTAREALSATALEQILRTSRRNNASVDVTGLLVVGGRRFLQALEGPADAVQRTYDRIQADPRHYGVVRLSNKAVEQRAFGDWAMGCRDVGISGDAGGSLPDIVARLVAPIEDASLRAEFLAFAELHAAA